MKHLENIPDWICKEGDNNICAYVDTDSNYYNAGPILNHKFPNFNSLPSLDSVWCSVNTGMSVITENCSSGNGLFGSRTLATGSCAVVKSKPAVFVGIVFW